MNNISFFGAFNQVSKRDLWLWGSVIILMTAKITFGDQSFFTKHFGHFWETGPIQDWMRWLYHHIGTFVLFALAPIMIIKLVLKEDLKNFGFQLGDWKLGLKATVVAMVILIIPVYISSQNPEHLEFYPLTTLATASPYYFFLWGLTYLPHYIGWELFFRGYIGFGMEKKHGAFMALSLQVLLSTLMHIGKPLGETWSTVAGGVYLGLLTYRTKSILWVIVFHFYLGMLNSYFCG